jgi:cell wall-associated NlpC family hydrolase
MLSREESVEIARSWVGTPYRLGGRVKGAGCDCASLIAEYLTDIGAATQQDLGVYSSDWFCNTTEDRYMLSLIRHVKKTMETIARGTPTAALPGNIVLFKVAGSTLYNHGGIVTTWPRMIHAMKPVVAECNAVKYAATCFTAMAIFDPWEKP